MSAAPPPPAPPAPLCPPHRLAPGRQLLIYTPDGALGGTFSCTVCAAQACHPDLLEHAPGCPYRPGALGPGAVTAPRHPVTGG